MLKPKPVFRSRTIDKRSGWDCRRKSIAIMASIHSNDSPRSFPQALMVIYSGNYALERRGHLDTLRTVGYRA